MHYMLDHKIAIDYINYHRENDMRFDQISRLSDPWAYYTHNVSIGD